MRLVEIRSYGDYDNYLQIMFNSLYYRFVHININADIINMFGRQRVYADSRDMNL